MKTAKDSEPRYCYRASALNGYNESIVVSGDHDNPIDALAELGRNIGKKRPKMYRVVELTVETKGSIGYATYTIGKSRKWQHINFVGLMHDLKCDPYFDGLCLNCEV